MKKSDIASLILIASLSVLTAYFVANAFLGKSQGESAKVRTVEKITADVKSPDPDVFNKDAINPTVEVIVGNK